MNGGSDDHLSKVLEKKSSCYVLITCEQPSENGDMQVEMTYQGCDATLAAYLLQGAQYYIDNDDKVETDHPVLGLVN